MGEEKETIIEQGKRESISLDINPNEKELKEFLISKGFKDNSPYPFSNKDGAMFEFGCGYITKIYIIADEGVFQDTVIDDFKISTIEELLHTLKYCYLDFFKVSV